MKRNVLLILTVLMVFSFGLVNAQDVVVDLDGSWAGGTKVKPETPLQSVFSHHRLVDYRQIPMVLLYFCPMTVHQLEC